MANNLKSILRYLAWDANLFLSQAEELSELIERSCKDEVWTSLAGFQS